MKKNESGQAMIEYLMVLIFISLIGIKFVQGFSQFFGQSLGNFGHVLSRHLTIGVCKEACWFSGYQNGYKE